MNREQARDRGCPAYSVEGNLPSTRQNRLKNGKLNDPRVGIVLLDNHQPFRGSISPTSFSLISNN